MERSRRSPLSFQNIRDKFSTMALSILKSNLQRGGSKPSVSGKFALVLAVTMILGVHFFVKLGVPTMNGKWMKIENINHPSEGFLGFQGEKVFSLGSTSEERKEQSVGESVVDYSKDKFSKGELNFIGDEMPETVHTESLNSNSDYFLQVSGDPEEEFNIERSDGHLQKADSESSVVIGDKEFPIKRILMDEFFFEVASEGPEKQIDGVKSPQTIDVSLENSSVDRVDLRDSGSLLVKEETDDVSQKSTLNENATEKKEVHRNKVKLGANQKWSHQIPEPTDEELNQWKNFRFGPRIDDWDNRREKYISEHPGSNVSRHGKPKVMLVTASDPEPCNNSVGDHLLLKLAKNKMDYARLKDMELYWAQGILRDDFDIYWAKYPLLHSLMLKHPYIEWFWWIDSDAMITDMTFDIPWNKYENYTLVLNGWDFLVHKQKEWTGVNAGVFLIRNCLHGLDLLDEWASYGPKGDVRWFWGPIFTNGLKGRPDNFDADDQAAILWTMIHKKESFGKRIYIESAYNLHSFWIWIVDKYEEMIKNHHPGLGDDRWPLVTHFVGCKICRFPASYDIKKCSNGIQRAFNFADNQVLKLYGYAHPDLSSTKVIGAKLEEPEKSRSHRKSLK